MKLDSKAVFEHFKGRGRNPIYDVERHCQLLIDTLMDKSKGTVCSFCVEAMITEPTFWKWVNTEPLFSDLYSFGKLYAREVWEREGRELKDITMPIGTISYAFDYWKLIGWSRFGVSKNSRIKLNLDPNATPEKHYSQLLKQACDGDFTAGEIKQLMEAVNVGLNTHQVFTLQKEIDQLKLDLATMNENTNAHNSGSNKGIAQKD